MNEKNDANLGERDSGKLGELVLKNPGTGTREDGPLIPKQDEQMIRNDIIIVAPHPDDEIIGCYEILRHHRPVIIYTGVDIPNERRENALKIKKFFNIKAQFFLSSIPPAFLDPTNTFFFPHPLYETHFEHRLQGIVGEQLARGSNENIYFYSTEMNAPFKHNCKYSKDKKTMLNSCYPDQASMWEYEHKYFLFSGYDKWVYDVENL